jgi:hypothetical protein
VTKSFFGQYIESLWPTVTLQIFFPKFGKNTSIDSFVALMNPAPGLRKVLEAYPAEDSHVVALLAIIDHLDANGPIFTGYPSEGNLQQFIRRIATGDTSSLAELAYSIEAYVRENLRKLLETCDRTQGLYPEVDQELELAALTKSAGQAVDSVMRSAAVARAALKKNEQEISARYGALNLRL